MQFPRFAWPTTTTFSHPATMFAQPIPDLNQTPLTTEDIQACLSLHYPEMLSVHPPRYRHWIPYQKISLVLFLTMHHPQPHRQAVAVATHHP